MKRLLLVMTCALLSCTNYESQLNDIQTEIDDVEILKQLGFETNNLIEMDDYYLLYPDVVFSKSHIEEIRNTQETRMQYNEKNKFLDIAHQTVYINNHSINDFSQCLDEAVSAWNNVGNTNIKFVIDNSVSNSVHVETMYFGESGALLYVDRPSKGAYGQTIILNGMKTFPPIQQTEMGKYLVMHALGHLIGFEHAITDNMDPSWMNGHIAGTDIFDSNSIMRTEDELGPTNKAIWSGLSDADKTAVRLVYPTIPPPKTSITSSPEGTGTDNRNLILGTTYQFTVKCEYAACPNPQYSISVIKVNEGLSGFDLKNIENGKTSIRFYRPGQYKMTVNVTNALEPIQFEKTFYLPATKYWIEGPASVKAGNTYDFYVFYWNPNYPNQQISLSIKESTFNSAKYTLTKITNNHHRICFEQPGDYTVTANIQNGFSSVSPTYRVRFYYWPAGINFRNESTFVTSQDSQNKAYLNKLYPYIDGSIWGPNGKDRDIKLEYRFYFRYYLKYANISPWSPPSEAPEIIDYFPNQENEPNFPNINPKTVYEGSKYIKMSCTKEKIIGFHYITSNTSHTTHYPHWEILAPPRDTCYGYNPYKK